MAAIDSYASDTTISDGDKVIGSNADNSDVTVNFEMGDISSYVIGNIEASDIPTLNQDTTGSAATLTTARNIAGQSFDGSANISIDIDDLGSGLASNPSEATEYNVQVATDGAVSLVEDTGDDTDLTGDVTLGTDSGDTLTVNSVATLNADTNIGSATDATDAHTILGSLNWNTPSSGSGQGNVFLRHDDGPDDDTDGIGAYLTISSNLAGGGFLQATTTSDAAEDTLLETFEVIGGLTPREDAFFMVGAGDDTAGNIKLNFPAGTNDMQILTTAAWADYDWADVSISGFIILGFGITDLVDTTVTFSLLITLSDL